MSIALASDTFAPTLASIVGVGPRLCKAALTGLVANSNLAPAFASSPNYTKSHWTEGTGSMAINYTGANQFAPTSAITTVSGVTYQIDLVLSSWTSGTFTVALGGVTSAVQTPSATNLVFRILLTATSNANVVVAAASSGAQVMTFSSLGVTAVNTVAIGGPSLSGTPLLTLPRDLSGVFGIWSDQGTWSIDSTSDIGGVNVAVAVGGTTVGSLYFLY